MRRSKEATIQFGGVSKTLDPRCEWGRSFQGLALNLFQPGNSPLENERVLSPPRCMISPTTVYPHSAPGGAEWTIWTGEPGVGVGVE
jgi:hypothetical protein